LKKITLTERRRNADAELSKGFISSLSDRHASAGADSVIDFSASRLVHREYSGTPGKYAAGAAAAIRR
jgi:hypothetical protein